MNPKNNKIFMIVFLTVIIVMVLSIVFSKNLLVHKGSNSPAGDKNSQTSDKEEERVNLAIDEAIKTQLKRPAKANEDIIKENGDSIDLGTTPEHWKETGIENAQISSEEEEKLYVTTVESMKAYLGYSSIRKERSLENVRNLYLPEEFKQYKEDVKNGGVYQSHGGVYQSPGDEYQFYNEIKAINFSKPRAYEGLSDRIGVIFHVEFNDSNANRLTQIYIFKNVNGEWKIEKQSEIIVRLDNEEDFLIKEIKDGK